MSLKVRIAGSILLCTSVAVVLALPAAADSTTREAKSSTNDAKSLTSDAKSFDKLYADWTKSFNQKDMVGTMSIFAPVCEAALPDANHKTYDQIEAGFKKLFADKSKSFKYTYDVLHIWRSGDLAAVRITWHLSTYENGKLIDKNDELGMDVLKRNKQGTWQIVNWVAFSDKLHP